jgi:hypothetical protein
MQQQNTRGPSKPTEPRKTRQGWNRVGSDWRSSQLCRFLRIGCQPVDLAVIPPNSDRSVLVSEIHRLGHAAEQTDLSTRHYCDKVSQVIGQKGHPHLYDSRQHFELMQQLLWLRHLSLVERRVDDKVTTPRKAG